MLYIFEISGLNGLVCVYVSGLLVIWISPTYGRNIYDNTLLSAIFFHVNLMYFRPGVPAASRYIDGLGKTNQFIEFFFIIMRDAMYLKRIFSDYICYRVIYCLFAVVKGCSNLWGVLAPGVSNNPSYENMEVQREQFIIVKLLLFFILQWVWEGYELGPTGVCMCVCVSVCVCVRACVCVRTRVHVCVKMGRWRVKLVWYCAHLIGWVWDFYDLGQTGQ